MRNIQQRAIRMALANRVYSRAVLAINAASAATIKTTNAIDYSVEGLMYQKAILSAQALTLDTTGQQAISGQSVPHTLQIGQTAYLTLMVDAAGNVRYLEGLPAGATSVVIGSNVVPLPPYKTPQGDGNIPDPNIGQSSELYTMFGYIKVACVSATFLPGTDALDKAGVTFTFQDVSGWPTNPRP